MASDPDRKVQKNQVEARQGTNRPGVIYVLGASIVLIVVAFAIVWATTKK